MISVQLCNKNEYKASGELTECHLRTESSRLKPSPSFSITGLDPEKMYQVFLSFKQIGNFRKNWCNALSNSPPLPFYEPNVEHHFGIASGQVYMDGITCFEGLRVTSKMEAAGGRIIHLNLCHKYTPILKIMEIDSQEPMKFSFDEASFRVGSNHVKRTKEKMITDKEEEEDLVQRQYHGPVSEVPVVTETKDSQSQVEGRDSPNVERQDSSSVNDQSLISVKLANKNLYTKTDGLTECLSFKEPRSLRPSPVFLVTGLDREKNYRVFLSFKQIGNLRKHRYQPLTSKPPLPFNEPNVEHKFGIASGEKIMDGIIRFEGLKITNSIKAAGGRTIHLNSCHKYTPMLKIMESDSREAVKFSFEEALFRVVKNLNITRAKKRKMTDEKDQENQKKRQCTDDEDEVLYQPNQEINTPIQCSLQDQSYQEQFQDRIRAPAQVGGQQVQLEEDAIHNQFQDQPDPQGHDEAVLAGAPQDRFRAQADIHLHVHDQLQVQHPGQPRDHRHFPQVQEHNNFQLQPFRVHGQLQVQYQHHGQVPQGTAQLPFEAHIHPQQSRHLTHFQSQSVLVHDYLPTQNQVPQGSAQPPFNARIHSQHNQFAPQLGHPSAPQVPVYPQIPVQASHAHAPHQPHYHLPQVPIHPPAQPPFNINPMIPPHPRFNNPIPQYPYPPMHRPTMFPTQQYPHQFNHPSPHNPNFMPHPQMFPQQFPPRNTHPQYPYNGPHHSYQ